MENSLCAVCNSTFKSRVDEEIQQGKSLRQVAKEFGFSKSSVQRHKKHTHEKEAQEIPNGIVTKVSTLYDADGQVKQQWVMEKPEDKDKLLLWTEIAKDIAKDIDPVAEMAMPLTGERDLLACYPIGDLHLGMLSWDKETGHDWDLKIGERVFDDAMDFLVDNTPLSDNALVAFLGDFMHYDSFESITPTGGNLLDSDSRYPKMVKVAIRSARKAIDSSESQEREGHRRVRQPRHLQLCVHGSRP